MKLVIDCKLKFKIYETCCILKGYVNLKMLVEYKNYFSHKSIIIIIILGTYNPLHPFVVLFF